MRRASAAAVLLVALVAAACGGTTPTAATTGPGVSAPAVSPSVPPASASPGPSSEPASAAPSGAVVASESPASSPEDTASAEPAQSASPSGEPSPSASQTSGSSASVCQPEGTNASFWSSIAGSVSWDVYCAVLPKGWNVSSGLYRLAHGGGLTIQYSGPGKSMIVLAEGTLCTQEVPCVPTGTDSGAATFGSMSGTLMTTTSGGYAVVVNRGQTPSWLMVTSGLDEATTISLAAALAHVTG